MVRRLDVYLVSLDPTIGSEIQKTRPCVVISPDVMHRLNSVIVAPMTTKIKAYPTRIQVKFAGKIGFIVLDQVRTVDKARLIQLLGQIDLKSGLEMLSVLHEMFEL